MPISRRGSQTRTTPPQEQHRQPLKGGTTFAAAFQYTEGARESEDSSEQESIVANPILSGVSPRRRAAQVAGMNGYNASTDLPPPLYVRALYNYEADDQTSLSFRQGDIIQVLTQLESGWWDGVINDVRGWFPSNYCAVISPDDPNEASSGTQDESEASTESGTEEEFDEEEEEDSDTHTQEDDSDLPIEGGSTQNQEEAAFWVPQATPDGRLYYFNTLTGVSTMELPLEPPTSADESGPRDRHNIQIPGQTRPPPEMMAGGFQHEDEYDGSASEADGEQSFSGIGRKASVTSQSNATTMSTESAEQGGVRTSGRNRAVSNLTSSVPDVSTSMAPLGTTATSFSVTPQVTLSRSTAPKHFLDDTGSSPLTWNILVENMQTSIEAYRQTIHNHERSAFVRRAEDISDHLRMLLAAGSGTTDNHSGNPSIISTNKALYPHFREMMSKFSKLVLSSHIAAADWPGPDAYTKCLQEADGVLNGVYGYVEIARQQRGEDIPRLVPGYVQGSKLGGNWRSNNIDNHMGLDKINERGELEPRLRSDSILDAQLLRNLDESKKLLVAHVHRLEDQLQLSEKIVSPARQAAIGDSICLGAGAVIEQFRPWISLIESIDLSPLGNVFQKPSLLEFATQKQKSYDSIGDLVTTCQSLTAPLPDEWSEIRGESLDTRLNNVRHACRQLESHVTNVYHTLQILLPAISSAPAPPGTRRDHRMTDGGETYQNHHLRTESGFGTNQRPVLADIGQSKSYPLGQDVSDAALFGPEKSRRPPPKDKARQFFGQMPPPLANVKAANPESGLPNGEVPWFLQLDHVGEITYDPKFEPPQVKSGSLTGLVEQLTRHDRSDLTFNTTFLLTYRSFTTASELFELLVKRFNLQPPSGLTRDEFLTWEENKQKPVRFRVVNILKSWLELYWMESSSSESQLLLERASAFAKNTVASTKIPLAGSLMKVIEQRMKGEDTSAKRLIANVNNSAPPAVLPKSMKKLKFLDIDPLEFARQLTIIESKLYREIKPIECLDKTWQKKDKNENSDPAPNVKALILHSNRLTNWVAEMILMHSEVRKRVNVVKQFVFIADRCRALNNFSTLTAIVSALGTAPILRLSRTWSQANDKTLNMLESMRTLIASTKNFAQYREALHAANPPCIPFLGVYLTDLTFIEDGIASLVKNTELINFTKRTKTAEVIRDIQQYQNVPYNLNQVPEIQTWILDNMKQAGDVHEMYNRSLIIEPREREEEKIARLLSESGFL